MDEYLPLSCFTREWVCYLEQHGHRVRQQAGHLDALVSRNGKGRGYRWLLRCSEDDSLLLDAPNRKEIVRQARLARRAGEECFVVVKFGHPGGTAVVVPADQAVKVKRLCAATGGIPWDC